MEKITLNKRYITTGFRPVRLFTTEARDLVYPVVGEIFSDNRWVTCSWTAEGKAYKGFNGVSMDLVEDTKPRKIEGWMNMFLNESMSRTLHPSKEIAESYAENAMIREACVFVSIEYFPGEGLE